MFIKCFSPRNGEVILKTQGAAVAADVRVFQSPQWGSNSKVYFAIFDAVAILCFSPRNGEVILKF